MAREEPFGGAIGVPRAGHGGIARIGPFWGLFRDQWERIGLSWGGLGVVGHGGRPAPTGGRFGGRFGLAAHLLAPSPLPPPNRSALQQQRAIAALHLPASPARSLRAPCAAPRGAQLLRCRARGGTRTRARKDRCGKGELARDRGFGLRAPGAAAMGGHASGCSVRSQRSSGPRARGTSAQCYLGGRLPLAAQADLSARHSLYGTLCEGGCGSLTSSGEAQHLSELKPKSTR